MSGVFISYRRDDANDVAHDIYEALRRRLPDTDVFIDAYQIDPGADFGRVIDEAVGFCDALVAVIGPRWSGSDRGAEHRRIDDPDDWVRREVESALSRGTTVVPVLVEGAAMPCAAELPPSLAELVERQSVEVRRQHLDADVARLGASLADAVARGNAASTWMAVVTRGHRALDPLDLHRPEALRRSLLFLALMVLIVDVMHLPLLAASAALPRVALNFASYLIANVLEWVAIGVCLHLGMRALGGHGSLQRSVAAFCLLSAFLPLIALAQIPVWGLPIEALKGGNGADIGSFLAPVVAFARDLHARGWLRVAVSFVLATFCWVLLMRGTIGAFRILHGITRMRAALGSLLGLSLYLAFLWIVYLPMIGLVYDAVLG